MTWTSADGRVTEIKLMATPHIENCLALIDERIPTLIKTRERGEQATRELNTKNEQKREMMRVLAERRRNSAAQVTPNSCYTCSHSDTVLNQLICKKLNNFCFAVNFSCGAWSGK